MEKPRFRGSKNKILIAIGSLLVLIGVVGFAFPFLPFRFSSDFEYLSEVAARTQANETVASDSLQLSTPSPSIDPSHPNIRNRLKIPSIGVDMPLIQDASANALLKGGWVFPGTSTPPQGGNTVIFGHRVRYMPPISNTFYKLDRVQVGDSLSIIWQGKTYSYRVTLTKLIEPTDLSVLNKTEVARVTLITCAPLFSTKQRLEVVAELVP